MISKKSYYIKIQTEDFNVQQEILELQKQSNGAVVSFIGFVRDFNKKSSLNAIYLDCYFDMAYKQIEHIVQDAIKLYGLNDVRIIHRVGRIEKEEQIVLVLVASTHRKEAFDGCAYIMDYLKIKAPFFKKEIDIQEKGVWLKK